MYVAETKVMISDTRYEIYCRRAHALYTYSEYANTASIGHMRINGTGSM